MNSVPPPSSPQPFSPVSDSSLSSASEASSPLSEDVSKSISSLSNLSASPSPIAQVAPSPVDSGDERAALEVLRLSNLSEADPEAYSARVEILSSEGIDGDTLAGYDVLLELAREEGEDGIAYDGGAPQLIEGDQALDYSSLESVSSAESKEFFDLLASEEIEFSLSNSDSFSTSTSSTSSPQKSHQSSSDAAASSHSNNLSTPPKSKKESAASEIEAFQKQLAMAQQNVFSTPKRKQEAARFVQSIVGPNGEVPDNLSPKTLVRLLEALEVMPSPSPSSSPYTNSSSSPEAQSSSSPEANVKGRPLSPISEGDSELEQSRPSVRRQLFDNSED